MVAPQGEHEGPVVPLERGGAWAPTAPTTVQQEEGGRGRVDGTCSDVGSSGNKMEHTSDFP